MNVVVAHGSRVFSLTVVDLQERSVVIYELEAERPSYRGTIPIGILAAGFGHRGAAIRQIGISFSRQGSLRMQRCFGYRPRVVANGGFNDDFDEFSRI